MDLFPDHSVLHQKLGCVFAENMNRCSGIATRERYLLMLMLEIVLSTEAVQIIN